MELMLIINRSFYEERFFTYIDKRFEDALGYALHDLIDKPSIIIALFASEKSRVKNLDDFLKFC